MSTEAAPAALGPYSQAVKAGSTLYISGQIGFDPSTMEFAGESVESQTTQVGIPMAVFVGDRRTDRSPTKTAIQTTPGPPSPASDTAGSTPMVLCSRSASAHG